MKLGIISDTHVSLNGRPLPDSIVELFQGTDAILHAGDVVTGAVLAELSSVAPVTAVLGNNDPWDLGLPERVVVRFDGINIGMIHDSGSKTGRLARMRQIFPDCGVVIFGHSHQPLIEDDEGLMLFNPGSACQPRRVKIPTVGFVEINQGRIRAWHEPVTR